MKLVFSFLLVLIPVLTIMVLFNPELTAVEVAHRFESTNWDVPNVEYFTEKLNAIKQVSPSFNPNTLPSSDNILDTVGNFFEYIGACFNALFALLYLIIDFLLSGLTNLVLAITILFG